ncbi:MAG: hypothetical protein SGJ10_06235 [Bacteroidota bacterium]|nr:hypothetical protein [Bacteroidota bacterium]
MKNSTLLIIIFSSLTFNSNAQDTIPNANFEQSIYYTDAGNITHMHTNFWKLSDSTNIWLEKYNKNIF